MSKILQKRIRGRLDRFFPCGPRTRSRSAPRDPLRPRRWPALAPKLRKNLQNSTTKTRCFSGAGAWLGAPKRPRLLGREGNNENGKRQGRGQAGAQEKTPPSPAPSRNEDSLPSHVPANLLQNLRRGIRKISRKEGKRTTENTCGKFRKFCGHRQK